MFFVLVIIFAVLLSFVLLWITIKPRDFPPGPLSLPFVGGLHHLRKDPFAASLELHEKYGPVVGIDMGSQRSVIVSDHKIIKAAFKNPALIGRPEMAGFQSTFRQKNGLLTGILLAEGKTFEGNRRFIVKEFGLGGGKKTEATILKHCLEILHYFSSNQGQVISATTFFNFYPAKIMWSLLAGRRIPDDKCIKNSMEGFDAMKHAAGVTKAVMIIPWLTKLLPKRTGWTGYVKSYNKFSANFKQSVDEHKQKPCTVDGQQDLVDRYLEEIAGTFSKDSIFYGDFGEFNLSCILGDLILAGVDTVSEVLSWSFILLINYPKIQEKIQMDIGDVIGKQVQFAGNLVTLAHRPKLPSLEAFLIEVMRFRPVAAWSLGHKAVTDTSIDKYRIPKGTVVYANLFSVAQDPLLWKNPDKFDPDRFINAETGKAEQPPQLEWFVFSTGLRKCPGRVLALEQLFLILGNILSKFSIKGEPWDPQPSVKYQPLFILTPQPYSFVVQKRALHI